MIPESLKAALRSEPFQFDEREMNIYEKTGEIETFRFIDSDKFNEDCLTLPIDKIVAGMVKKKFLLTD